MSFTFRELGSILQVPTQGASFYAKNSWHARVNREEIVTQVTGYTNLTAPTTAKHDKMPILHKILAMLVLNNIVPRKEGRLKTDSRLSAHLQPPQPPQAKSAKTHSSPSTTCSRNSKSWNTLCWSHQKDTRVSGSICGRNFAKEAG